MSKPQCFGFIPVVTAGPPVPLATVSSATQLQTQDSRSWTIQAIRANNVANTGAIALGIFGMNKTTGFGVIAYLSAGTFFNAGANMDSFNYDLTQLYIDAYTSGDGVLLTSFA